MEKVKIHVSGERGQSNSTKSKSLIKPIESGGKTHGVKKVSLCGDNNMEKLKKQPKFYTEEAQIKYVFFTTKLMILLVYKGDYLNNKNLDYIVSSITVFLLHEYDDVFPKDFPSGLPSIKGIEHQITLYPEHRFLIIQPIEAILRRQKSFKYK